VAQETIIVTGSSGLIGNAVCDWLAKGAVPIQRRVVGFDRPGMPHPPPSADNVPCDLTSNDSVRDAIAYVRGQYGERVASVIHLAAYYDFSGAPSPLYDKITVGGTRRLLAALKHNLTVEQFIFSSTMLVHAPCQPGQRINEDWPLEPKWDYPKSKVDTENLLSAERGEIPIVLLRIAGVYDDHCDSIPIANQIQRIYERQLTGKVFPGDISTGQAFVHIDDLVDAMVRAVDRRASLGPETTLLIGEPDPLSYDEVQRMLAWLIHDEKDWDTTRVPKPVAKAGAWVQDKIPGVEDPFIQPWMIDLADDHYALDITRARKLLDWAPKRSLRETLPKMVEFLKSDPDGFYKANKLQRSPTSSASSKPDAT
jgi:nucleoside-diphosphate-sugar epimerase